MEAVNPDLIIVGGWPGTGKTTIAKIVAERIGAVCISKDVYKEALFDAIGCEDPEWSQWIGSVAFSILQNHVLRRLLRGESVVAESVFRKQDAQWISLSRGIHGTSLYQVHLKCDERERLRRIDKRVRDGERHPGHFDNDYQARFKDRESHANQQSLSLQLRCPTLTVDTTNWSKVNIDEIVSFLYASDARFLRESILN